MILTLRDLNHTFYQNVQNNNIQNIFSHQITRFQSMEQKKTIFIRIQITLFIVRSNRIRVV